MKIFLIIALFFASSLQFLLDYVWPEKNKPTRYKIIRGLLFILILIVFIASITTEVRDEKEKGELKELAGKSITLLTENKKIATDNKHLNEKIAFKNEEIAILSKKIVDKSGQIEKLNQNISSNVTGGDAYCYLEPSIDPKTDRMEFILNHRGKYPVYDINVRITDMGKRKKLPFDELLKDYDSKTIKARREIGDRLSSQVNSTDLFFKVDALMPNTYYRGQAFDIPEDTDELQYFIEIQARNGNFTELLAYQRIHGQWQRSVRLYKVDSYGKATILLENLHPKIRLVDWYH